MGWPGPMTRRQFLAWRAWLDSQWNRPSRTDNYVMQVAAEIRRGHVKRPRSVKHEHFELQFKVSGKKPRHEQLPEQKAALSKGKWLGMMKGAVEKVELPRELLDPIAEDKPIIKAARLED